ncbi:hypothetical protein RJ639_006191 [Escallonia herrerae]|uniref:rhamnogalacturonan endolyase n=1 Tax=Escallonia herrerae TaxID=1293975 RepID=A0AA89ATN5_9ASTE|nr:hypothetical protein RJ639_006191 [Escallonia herrerae]
MGFTGVLGRDCSSLVHHLRMCCDKAVRKNSKKSSLETASSYPVQLRIEDDHVVVDNGLIKVTFSSPGGMITGIEYNGIDNILEETNKESNRGYWDVVWTELEHAQDTYDKLEGTKFKVVMEDEDQVEISFTKHWYPSRNGTGIPLNVDKRFVVLRGYTGFYAYGIFERLAGWRGINIYQGRIAFKLRQDSFRYMAVSDERQRIMPTAQDRERGEPLQYPEAVLLTNPSNAFLKGEVDDKYQYSSENKDNRVHGWICSKPSVGFWMITPSTEFRTAGPVKQDLTSHAGPVTLSMFFSTHYAGEHLGLEFSDGEPWKKVFGPVFVYLNSVSKDEDPLTLWADAKEQMSIETESWPYDFPLSEDYLFNDQRGMVSGRLLVRDRYINQELITANSAYVGLAPPGDVGSWQTENKGYQFWTQADVQGYFRIKGVLPGNYSLYAWVPGILGDYKYDVYIEVTPERTNRYMPLSFRFRQYGLWDRYTELYPDIDLIYTVGLSNYQTDWFFAHVNRLVGNGTYVPTTWQILFDLKDIDQTGNYTLQLALASATTAELQVRINDLNAERPYFTTGLIGKDNAIARHGIHGLYWLYSIYVSGSHLQTGTNTIFLTQPRGGSPFKGIMCPLS